MYRRKAILVNTVMFLAAAMITAKIVGALIPNGRSDFMRVAALVIFAIAPLFGVVAFRYGEPVLLRGMLLRAVQSSEASGGVVLLSSVSGASAVVNAYLPVEGSLLHRASMSETGVRGASRLVAVRVADGVELRTGSGGDLLVAKVPQGQFSLARDCERTTLMILAVDGSSIASFPVISAATARLAPLPLAEAEAALASAAPNELDSID